MWEGWRSGAAERGGEGRTDDSRRDESVLMQSVLFQCEGGPNRTLPRRRDGESLGRESPVGSCV